MNTANNKDSFFLNGIQYNQNKNERKYFTANDEWFCLNQYEIDIFMLV